MSPFDIPTIVVMTALSSGMMAIVLLAAYRSFPAGINGLGFWALGSVSLLLGRLLTWLRVLELPEPLSVVLANGLLFAGMGLWLEGTRVFYGRHADWREFGFVLGVGVAGNAWFLWATPDINARVALFSLMYCLCNLRMLTLIARHGERQFSTGFFATLIAVYALVTLGRTLTFLVLNSDPSLGNGSLNLVYLMLSNFMSLMLPVGFMTVATRRLQAVLELRSNLDPLTGALNRRGFVEQYEQEVARMRRDGQPLSLLSIDLDFFKAINDRYGHGVGDRVLTQVTDVILLAKRATDHVARFGGEEFIVLLPATGGAAALAVAQRIQALLREHGGGELPACTVSIGIASQERPEQSLDAVLARSDAALYRAKAAGRDCIALDEALAGAA